MTFLFDLPNEKLIPATFDLVEKISELNIAELKSVREEGESAKEAGERFLKRAGKRICKEKPEVAVEICKALWELEEGEKEPSAITTFSKCVGRQDVMDFFISLLTLV